MERVGVAEASVEDHLICFIQYCASLDYNSAVEILASPRLSTWKNNPNGPPMLSSGVFKDAAKDTIFPPHLALTLLLRRCNHRSRSSRPLPLRLVRSSRKLQLRSRVLR